MSKTKATVWLSIIGVIVVLLMAFSVFPNLKIGYYNFKSPASAITRGTDFVGGSVSYLKVEDNDIENIEAKLENAIDIMAKRAADFSQRNSYFAVMKDQNGEYGVLVKLDPQNTSSSGSAATYFATQFAQSGKLEIRALDAEGDIITDAENIRNARTYYQSNTWYVQLRFNKTGADAMKEASKDIASSSGSIYFMMDGEETVAFEVSSKITTNYVNISGFDSGDDAIAFAVLVNNGAYDVSFDSDSMLAYNYHAPVNESTYFTVMIAMAVILVGFIVFSIMKYGLLGVGATLSMFGYSAVALIALALFTFVEFSLVSAIGLLVGFCATCAFNLYIQSLIVKEFAEGKSLKRSIQEGCRKSRKLIIDICAVTILFSIALWILSAAPVLGLATMLVVSMAASLLSSLFLTWLFVSLIGSIYSDNLQLFKLQTKGGSR